MRLLDLDPRWLMRDGQKVGFIFLSPKEERPVHWRQTCFFAPTPFKDQCALVWEATADLARGPEYEFGDWQPCAPNCAWTAHGPLDFETLTVTPSLDGSAGGLWHGFITNGQIVGGV